MTLLRAIWKQKYWTKNNTHSETRSDKDLNNINNKTQVRSKAMGTDEQEL